MKKAIIALSLLACITVNAQDSTYSKKAIEETVDTVKDSVELKVSDDFINYKKLAVLEQAIKTMISHPEYMKLNAIDQYNQVIKPLFDKLVADSKKEWEEKRKKK